MKPMIAIISVALQLSSNTVMADDQGLAHQAKRLLLLVESHLPEEHRDIYSFVENQRGWKKSTEFAELEKFVSGNWKAILADIEDIVDPSEIHQFILFSSFQSVPQKASFQCLDKVADLCLTGTISPQMFSWVMVSHAINNRGVLARNYKDPVVAEVLRKASMIDPEHRDYYKRMASGKAKRELEHPLHYDTDTGEEPNITSVKSWAVFLGRMFARVAAVGVAVLGAIMAWRYFWRKKKQA